MLFGICNLSSKSLYNIHEQQFIFFICEPSLLFRIHGLTSVKLVSIFQLRDSVLVIGGLYNSILDLSYANSRIFGIR